MYGPVVDLYRLVKNVLGLGWKQGALLLAQLCSTLRMHVLGHPLHTLIEVRKITAACLLNCSSTQGDTVGQRKRQRAFWDHVNATVVNTKSELKHGVTPHLYLVGVAASRPDPACIDTRRVQRWTKGECPAAWVAPPPEAPQPRQAPPTHTHAHDGQLASAAPVVQQNVVQQPASTIRAVESCATAPVV